MPQGNFSCEIPPKINIFLISLGQRELIIIYQQESVIVLNTDQMYSLYSLHHQSAFIQIPHKKICLQNPSGNKFNIILIFIMSRKMCKKRKDIFISSNEMLCTDWQARAASGPVQHVLKCKMMSVGVLSLELLVGTKFLISK